MKGSRFALGFLLVLALFSASRLSYLALYVVAGIFALFHWGTKWVYDHLRLERHLSAKKAYIGQEITVTITVANECRYPLGWISLQTANLANFEVVDPLGAGGILAGRDSFSLAYRMTGITRGFYRLGEIRVSGGDPLGWNDQETVIPDSGEAVTIYPRITPLAGVPLPNVQPFGTQRDMLRAHEDPTRLAGVRDYQPGDSLRRIHWRASASRGRLQVKEFIPTVTAESLILLNMGEAEYPTGTWAALGELGVEAAASLAAHLIRLATAVGFATNGGDPEHPGPDPLFLPPAGGAGQAEGILTILARLEVTAGAGFAGLVAAHGRNAVWGASLFIITPAWDAPLADLSLALRRSGKIPVPMLLEPKGGELAAAVATGAPIMVVRRDRDRGGVLISHAS